MIPLREGEVPPVRILSLINGEWVMTEYTPIYDPEYVDPEVYETETYSQEDKDEMYDYMIRCKACRTEFIAYDIDGNKILNYCPGCGKKLK